MHTTRNPKRILLALLAGAALLAAAAPAQAQENNQGTIKVHLGVDADPDMRNEPHVECIFWVEGFNMAGANGTLVFTAWAPTGDNSVVLEANYAGELEDDEDGFHFLAGPFTLPAGHYRVEAHAEVDHPGGEHFAKAKMFWVLPCEGEIPMECPPGLEAQANADGSVTLTFAAAANATATVIYRAEGDGDFEFLAATDANATAYTDSDTEVGVTYTYMVTALFGVVESQVCDVVEVTTIPVFPTALGAALAGILGVAAYAVVRRRN